MMGPFFKILRKIKLFSTGWIAKESLEHYEAVRKYELDIVLSMLPPVGSVLEIGAGAGWQAKILSDKGYTVSAIDIETSNLAENRIWPITNYDGKHIPFPDNSFDIIFSSNVLEHIPHVKEFQSEIQRVLKKDGYVIHLMPSATWRFFTNITVLLKHWQLPSVHGEHSPNAIAEITDFTKKRWMRLFSQTGWIVKKATSNNLFYTGMCIMDTRLGTKTRKSLSHFLGGSCNIFLLQKSEDK
jgi:2-polyprenyl-3-methyl-5-hydroxy-6-metoxy-1,4-benzoquinol methylase